MWKLSDLVLSGDVSRATYTGICQSSPVLNVKIECFQKFKSLFLYSKLGICFESIYLL